MYIPDLYKNENAGEIREFLTRNSFAALVSEVDGKPWATHLPLDFATNENGGEVLLGHMSRENPQWREFNFEKPVLAIFTGPHSYISPSWYDHENVPTWNYIAVHVYGRIKLFEGNDAVRVLKMQVDKYEANSENPVRIEDLSKKTMRQANGVVAFEIAICEIQATRKMSQNRDAKNYENIIGELQKSGNPDAAAVASEMSKKR